MRIGAAIASSVVRTGAPVTKRDAMIAIIRPPLWRPYFFLAQAALDQMPSTPAASRRPGLSVQPLSDKDVTWLPRFFLSIVVQYIDGQPARIHEDFNNFALEALRANWPCSLGANAHDPLAVALH